MKRIFAILLLCCVLLCACARTESGTPTTTAPATDAPTESAVQPTEPNTEPPTSAPTDEPTDANAPIEEPYALCESSSTVNCYRDSQGAIWAQTIIAVTNLCDYPLFLSNATSAVLQDADGAEVAVIKNISAYPQVIATGETGYYYEETQLDLGETAELSLFPDIIAREATQEEVLLATPLTVTDDTLSESVYGGLRLTGRVAGCDGLTCISAVLFDKDAAPVGLLFTLTSINGESDFELNSFMLPEDLTAAGIADYRIYAYSYQQ